MKIIIKSPNERTIRLIFPTRLLFNSLTAKIGAAALKKYVPSDKFKIKPRDLHKLIKEINRIKRKYPGLVLVDVETSDGDIVKIKL